MLKKLKFVLGQFNFYWCVKNGYFDAYNKIKELLTEENSNTTMIQIDLAKFFACLDQDENANAHCKANSVTLFTVMIWFHEESISMVIVPDNKRNNKRTLFHIGLLFLIMRMKCSEKIYKTLTFQLIAHLANSKLNFSLSTLVIAFLSCFLIST